MKGALQEGLSTGVSVGGLLFDSIVCQNCTLGVPPCFTPELCSSRGMRRYIMRGVLDF